MKCDGFDLLRVRGVVVKMKGMQEVARRAYTFMYDHATDPEDILAVNAWYDKVTEYINAEFTNGIIEVAKDE